MTENEERLFELVKRLLEFLQLSWKTYVLILVIAAVLFSISLPFGWLTLGGPFYSHWIELLKNVAPSMVAAFFIVWFTDFVNQRNQSAILLEQKKGLKTIQEAFDWGLKLFPNHHVITNKEDVLKECVSPRDTIRILSGRCKEWLDEENLLRLLLAKEGVNTKVIIFSPEMYAERLFKNFQPIGGRGGGRSGGRGMKDQLIHHISWKHRFTRYDSTGSELIANHHSIKRALEKLPAEEQARIEVRFTGIIPLCEFFVISDKRSHGAVPMLTKTHKDSFSIQTFWGLKSGKDNVQVFIKEFEFFWKKENSISKEEYFARYAQDDSKSGGADRRAGAVAGRERPPLHADGAGGGADGAGGG